MKPAAIRELTHDELVEKQRETTKELFEARLEAATGQLGHTHRVKMLRRRLARLNTIRREREPQARREAAAEESRPAAG